MGPWTDQPMRQFWKSQNNWTNSFCFLLSKFPTCCIKNLVDSNQSQLANWVLKRKIDKLEKKNYCCLGRVPYGIRRYSTRYVRHSTITHVWTVQQTLERLLSRNGANIRTVNDFVLYRTARLSAGGAWLSFDKCILNFAVCFYKVYANIWTL